MSGGGVPPLKPWGGTGTGVEVLDCLQFVWTRYRYTSSASVTTDLSMVIGTPGIQVARVSLPTVNGVNAPAATPAPEMQLYSDQKLHPDQRKHKVEQPRIGVWQVTKTRRVRTDRERAICRSFAAVEAIHWNCLNEGRWTIHVFFVRKPFTYRGLKPLASLFSISTSNPCHLI
jgi:hypothetical protein